MECKPCDTLIESGQRLDISEDKEGVDKGQCQISIRRLIYLLHTWPEIKFAVSEISHFMHNPKNYHLQLAYKVLRHMKGTPGKGIL